MNEFMEMPGYCLLFGLWLALALVVLCEKGVKK